MVIEDILRAFFFTDFKIMTFFELTVMDACFFTRILYTASKDTYIKLFTRFFITSTTLFKTFALPRAV
jgi:hypothetical protein